MMNKSEVINELAASLSKLQGEISDVFKDKKGYGYNYADLSSILEEARPLLAKHGLSIAQLPASAHDKVVLETLLMHSSGQWVSSTIEMGVERGKGMSLAQAVGSVITYARRYALAAMLGISQTDDDATSRQVEVSNKIEEFRKPGAHFELLEKIKKLRIGNEVIRSALNAFNCAKITELDVSELDAFMEIVMRIQDETV